MCWGLPFGTMNEQQKQLGCAAALLSSTPDAAAAPPQTVPGLASLRIAAREVDADCFSPTGPTKDRIRNRLFLDASREKSCHIWASLRAVVAAAAADSPIGLEVTTSKRNDKKLPLDAALVTLFRNEGFLLKLGLPAAVPTTGAWKASNPLPVSIRATAPPAMKRQLSAELAQLCNVDRSVARAALDDPANMVGGERNMILAGKALFQLGMGSSLPHRDDVRKQQQQQQRPGWVMGQKQQQPRHRVQRDIMSGGMMGAMADRTRGGAMPPQAGAFGGGRQRRAATGARTPRRGAMPRDDSDSDDSGRWPPASRGGGGGGGIASLGRQTRRPVAAPPGAARTIQIGGAAAQRKLSAPPTPLRGPNSWKIVEKISREQGRKLYKQRWTTNCITRKRENLSYYFLDYGTGPAPAPVPCSKAEWETGRREGKHKLDCKRGTALYQEVFGDDYTHWDEWKAFVDKDDNFRLGTFESNHRGKSKVTFGDMDGEIAIKKMLVDETVPAAKTAVLAKLSQYISYEKAKSKDPDISPAIKKILAKFKANNDKLLRMLEDGGDLTELQKQKIALIKQNRKKVWRDGGEIGGMTGGGDDAARPKKPAKKVGADRKKPKQRQRREPAKAAAAKREADDAANRRVKANSQAKLQRQARDRKARDAQSKKQERKRREQEKEEKKQQRERERVEQEKKQERKRRDLLEKEKQKQQRDWERQQQRQRVEQEQQELRAFQREVQAQRDADLRYQLRQQRQQQQMMQQPMLHQQYASPGEKVRVRGWGGYEGGDRQVYIGPRGGKYTLTPGGGKTYLTSRR